MLLALGAVSVLGPGPSPAAAQEVDVDVTSADAAQLTRDALTSTDARTALLTLERVDGRPVDLGPVVSEATPGDEDRLRVLADEFDQVAGRAGTDVVVPTDRARDQAEAVLADDKFQQSDVPKPFKGLLEWMADRVRPIGDFFGRLFEPILALPGGPFILAGLFAAAAGLAIGWLVSRRSKAVLAGRSRAGLLVDRDADPDELDRRAADAEASAMLGEAVRLRYQAGLLRLAREGRLSLRADTTAAGAARQVDQDDMWALTDDFEQIVYGDRVATAQDVADARQRWTILLAARVGR